jgi:uncharacterized protein YoxC
MDAIQICYCILILSGAFALVSLGLLLIQTASTVKEVSALLTMLETTISKVNHILDDIDNKLQLLNAPVELITGIFSKTGLKSGVMSGVGFASSLLKRKKRKGDKR